MLGKQREKYILLFFPISICYPLGHGSGNFFFKAPGKTKKEHAFCFRKHCMQIAPRHFRLPPENRGPGPQLTARKTGCGVSILRWQVPRKDFCSYGSTQTKLWLRNHELEFYTLFSLPNLHLFDNTFLLMEDQLSHKSYHFICTGETAFDSWHLRMDADLIFFLGFFGQGRGSEFLFSSMEGVYKRAFLLPQPTCVRVTSFRFLASLFFLCKLKQARCNIFSFCNPPVHCYLP